MENEKKKVVAYQHTLSEEELFEIGQQMAVCAAHEILGIKVTRRPPRNK
jgi:hypothetical protein